MGYMNWSNQRLNSFDEPRRETTKIRSVRKPRDKSNVERKYQILTEMVCTSVCVECFPLKYHCVRRVFHECLNKPLRIHGLSSALSSIIAVRALQ
jgi:hypothetical protein